MRHIQGQNFVAEQLEQSQTASPTTLLLVATLIIGQILMWGGLAGFLFSSLSTLLSIEPAPAPRQFEAVRNRSRVTVIFWGASAVGMFLSVIPALRLGINLRRGGYRQVLDILRGIQRNAQLKAGLEGEQRVADLLSAALDDRWTLLSSVVVEGLPGDIDHVLVGPAGIFAIEVKHWSGWLYYDHADHRWRRVNPRAGILLAQAKDPTRLVRLGSQILARSMVTSVVPLLVLTHGSAQFHGDPPDVQVLYLRDLLPWLEAQPAVLNDHQVQQAVSRIQSLMK